MTMVTEKGVVDILNKKRPTITECKAQIRELLTVVNQQEGSMTVLTNRCKQLIDTNSAYESRLNNVALENDKLRNRNVDLSNMNKKLKRDNRFLSIISVIIAISAIVFICLV